MDGIKQPCFLRGGG